MTDYQFETLSPVALYVEIGAGEVDVSFDGRNLSIVAPKRRTGFFSGDDGVNVTVVVPTGSDLAARTGSADIGVVGEVGSAHVKTGSGDVRVDVLTGPATIETGSGDVEVEEARSELRVKCGSGDVVTRHAESSVAISTGSGDVQIGTNQGPALVKTGSGDVRIIEAASDVALTTGSGDLQIETARRGKFSAKGASGSIHVGIPAGTPVWTDISTVSGRIHSDVEGAGEPAEGADHVELRATTVSGDVILTQR